METGKRGCCAVKVIERDYLKQIIQHLERHKLIGHQHHGVVQGKSTQTLVTELQDLLVEDRTKGQESFLIALDQSKAYDFCGLLDAQKCDKKPPAMIEDNFLDPNKPLFCVRDHQIFLANNMSHI